MWWMDERNDWWMTDMVNVLIVYKLRITVA